MLPNLALTHPGWIILMVVGFVFWWPLGLLVLALILWSGSMGRQNGQWIARLKEFAGFRFKSSGNDAFEQHRKTTLNKLEEEEKEFREFVDKVRFAKDKDSFEEFMANRKKD